MKTKEEKIDLREKFRNETKMRVIVEDGYGNSFFTEDYVEWLESKLNINRTRDNLK